MLENALKLLVRVLRARVPKMTLLSNTSCTPHAAGLQAYKDFKVSEGMDPEEIQATIDAALDFAFDDYEMVEAEEEEESKPVAEEL